MRYGKHIALRIAMKNPIDKVSIGIPTIEGRENIVFNCIVSVLGQKGPPWDLTICTTNKNVKIGDRNDSLVLNRMLRSIQEMGTQVKVIYDTSKEGPGQAVQMLIDNTESKWLFRVDDDVILTPDVLNKLSGSFGMEDNLAAVACPANGIGATFVDYEAYWTKTAYQPHLQLNGHYKSMNDNFSHHSALKQDRLEVAEVDFLSGYAILVDKDKVKEVGGYYTKDSPKHHREDWWATLRLREKGYRLWVRGDAVSFHHHFGIDESDNFRQSRADLDKSIFDKFKSGIDLQEERSLGRITNNYIQKYERGVWTLT